MSTVSDRIDEYLDHVWPCTNEEGQEETQRIIRDQPVRGNAIYGCSGFFVLNLASLSPEITHVSIFDLSDRVREFWSEAQKIFLDPFLTYETAEKRFLSFVETYRHGEQLLQECQHNLSFLSSEERFERIRAIFLRDHFSFTKLHLGDPDQFHRFLDTQAAQGARPQIIYLSNIPTTISAMGESIEGFEKFRRSMELLPKNAIIIEAKKMAIDECVRQIVHIPPEGLGPITPNYHVLMGALNADDYERASRCIALGADPNERDQINLTPLMIMAETGYFNSIRALVDSGKVDVNQRGELGMTALHILACRSKIDAKEMDRIIEFLASHGADLDAQDTDGETPVSLAATLGSVRCLKTLLRLGADPRILNHTGLAPLARVMDGQTPVNREPDLAGDICSLLLEHTPEGSKDQLPENKDSLAISI
jgi:hypothetical protein